MKRKAGKLLRNLRDLNELIRRGQHIAKLFDDSAIVRIYRLEPQDIDPNRATQITLCAVYKFWRHLNHLIIYRLQNLNPKILYQLSEVLSVKCDHKSYQIKVNSRKTMKCKEMRASEWFNDILALEISWRFLIIAFDFWYMSNLRNVGR